VVTAKDGVDAVARLQETIPDAMLLDIEMPRMDGYELATHMRNDERLRHVPIIMITSRTSEKHRERAFEIGVNRYLGKPYQEAELLANLQEVLEEAGVEV
jgi:chemosensory pili system protein ChpA (sensor histidine kinase/response regulator)